MFTCVKAICTTVSGWEIYTSCNYFPGESSFTSNISIGACSYFSLSLMYYVSKNYPPRFVFITCNFLVFLVKHQCVCVCVCVCVCARLFNCHYSRGGLIILAVTEFAFTYKGYTSAVAISNVSNRDVPFLLLRKRETLIKATLPARVQPEYLVDISRHKICDYPCEET